MTHTARPQTVALRPPPAARALLTAAEQLLLNSLPTITYKSLWHIGLLGNSAAQSEKSLEGPLLSVSLHPDAWRRIAQLGGLPLWQLDKKCGFSLYDFHAFSEQQKHALTELAISRGLIDKTSAWRAWFYDSENDACSRCGDCKKCGADDGWRFFLCTSREEAEGESRGELREDGSSCAEEVVVETALIPLQNWWCSRMTNRPDDAGLWHYAAEAAWCLLLELHGSGDGVWWNEALLPEALSAPRGGLFQRCLPGCSASSNDTNLL